MKTSDKPSAQPYGPQSPLARAGKRDGMTVPDGFFEDFAAHMSESLPHRPEAEEAPPTGRPKTLWGSIRPYVYMAAMFAGIWCMLKMFTLMSSNAGVDLSIDNNRVLTEALSDDNFVFDYIDGEISDRELLDEMYDDSIDVDEMFQPADAVVDVADLEAADDSTEEQL